MTEPVVDPNGNPDDPDPRAAVDRVVEEAAAEAEQGDANAEDTGDAEDPADTDPEPALNDDAADDFADLPEGDDDGTDDGLEDEDGSA